MKLRSDEIQKIRENFVLQDNIYKSINNDINNLQENSKFENNLIKEEIQNLKNNNNEEYGKDIIDIFDDITIIQKDIKNIKNYDDDIILLKNDNQLLKDDIVKLKSICKAFLLKINK